jgi:hypothetical protein
MEVDGQLHALALLLQGKQRGYPFYERFGWTSDPVRTLQRREQTLAPAGNRNFDFRAVDLVA